MNKATGAGVFSKNLATGVTNILYNLATGVVLQPTTTAIGIATKKSWTNGSRRPGKCMKCLKTPCNFYNSINIHINLYLNKFCFNLL